MGVAEVGSAVRRLVQFPHPGTVGGAERCAWPKGSERHVRKLLRVEGCSRDAVEGEDRTGSLLVWGEWEGESVVDSVVGGRVVHRPLVPSREQRPPGVPQNTDPFIFGDRLQYTFCGQARVSAKKLHSLAAGSVIVF